MYAEAIALSLETFAAEVGFESFELKNKNEVVEFNTMHCW